MEFKLAKKSDAEKVYALVQATIESTKNQRLNHELMDFSATFATIKPRKGFFRISKKEKKQCLI